jgi:hypothetical protein
MCVGTVAELPDTALRDPDVERFILFGVEASCDLLRRLDGDGMLLGTAPEYDSDLQPIHVDFCFRI